MSTTPACHRHSFPLCRTADEVPTHPALQCGSSRRILVVDDDEINLIVAQEILLRAGYDVTGAQDGREALEKWGNGGYDIVLMDIEMPVMDGIEALIALREREQESGGHLPVIAVTARVLSDDRAQILSHGFDGYLAKPFGIDTLLDEIDRCLGAAERGPSTE